LPDKKELKFKNKDIKEAIIIIDRITLYRWKKKDLI
jgi:hypothetical protein